jgi:two-component system response regulator AtoC
VSDGSKGARVTVVDDDLVTCELLCEVFAQAGFAARFVQSGEAALEAMSEMPPDVLVSDIRMSTRLDGLALLEQVKQRYPSVPVVLITAFGSIDTAIHAVKEGAFDYISKPFDIGALVATVRRAIASHKAAVPADDAARDAGVAVELKGLIVGHSPPMLAVYKMVARVADAQAAVLVTGESGTGKELVARAIHTNGPRAREPFVAVNCGALTETILESELFGHVKGSFTGAVANRCGLFEQAGQGTVFLDEVSEMSPGLQVKLLRVLQEREVMPVGASTPVPVHARVIAASNTDLERLSATGAFRRDLLYRLDVVNIHVPPLRARVEDIPLLIAHFLRKYRAAKRCAPVIDERAEQLLLAYQWPGNVRELENTIERAVTLCPGGVITEGDLPPHIKDAAPDVREPADTAPAADPSALFRALPTMDELERQYLIHVLKIANGNRTHASEILGINRRTLYRMASRFGVDL